MTVRLVPKLGIELLEFLKTFWTVRNSPETD